MKIYTKTGDKGDTGLIGGKRVPKNDPRVCAYGDVDELNAALGHCAAHVRAQGDAAVLGEDIERVQAALFHIGAILASPTQRADIGDFPSVETPWLEARIDAMETELPPLSSFILPGGSPQGAHLHLCRTVCRRAERSVLGVSGFPAEVLVFLNRLSDYLFVAARWVNRKGGVEEIPWRGAGK